MNITKLNEDCKTVGRKVFDAFKHHLENYPLDNKIDKETIEALIEEHKEAPHLRLLQNKLAEEVTIFVHSKEDYENAVKASKILFSKDFKNEIKQLPETLFLDVFEGVKHAEISKAEFNEGIDMIGALAAKTDFLSSNGDARRALKENAVAVNKEKVKEDYILSSEDLIHDKYIIISRGKKTNFLLSVI